MIPHLAAPIKCYGLNSLYFIFSLCCKQHWHLTITLMKSKKLYVKTRRLEISSKPPFSHFMLWSVITQVARRNFSFSLYAINNHLIDEEEIFSLGIPHSTPTDSS